MKPRTLTLVIPTHCERENMEPLLTRLRDVMPALSVSLDLLIVDSGSADGTVQAAEALLGRVVPGRVMAGPADQDLARAVATGFREAQGELIGVMDADLSHPPELLPDLVRAIAGGCDVVVASRYVPGGGIAHWPWARRWLSRLGNWVVRPLTPVADATSGYFVCRAAFIKPLRLETGGFKILLEALVAGRPRRVQEIPYVFTDRVRGSSKLHGRTLRLFIAQVLRLYRGGGRRAED